MIHRHAGRERIICVDQPFGKGEPAASAGPRILLCRARFVSRSGWLFQLFLCFSQGLFSFETLLLCRFEVLVQLISTTLLWFYWLRLSVCNLYDFIFHRRSLRLCFLGFLLCFRLRGVCFVQF